MDFPFPVLLSDIGGTNARFALAPAPHQPLESGPHLKTGDFPSLEAAIDTARKAFSVAPNSMIACAAGPVDGRQVSMTNAAWVIDGAKVAAATGLRQGLLLNDFEAQALSLPALSDASVKWIGAARPGKGPQLVLGPGTGLGASLLLEVAGKMLALPSEAGHVEFGPTNLEETAIWGQMAGPPFRITAESLLSGPGLVRLHFARLSASKIDADSLEEVALVTQAHSNPEGEEAQTVRLFWHLIARFAGDLALIFLAKGGVTLAGGILPRIVGFLKEDEFRAAFENKAPYGGLMQSIATRLITAPDSVLDGMAAIAATPDRYCLDAARRAWCSDA